MNTILKVLLNNNSILSFFTNNNKAFKTARRIMINSDEIFDDYCLFDLNEIIRSHTENIAANIAAKKDNIQKYRIHRFGPNFRTSAPRFRVSTQQDIDEFLAVLIDIFIKQLVNIKEPILADAFNDIFLIKITSTNSHVLHSAGCPQPESVSSVFSSLNIFINDENIISIQNAINAYFAPATNEDVPCDGDMKEYNPGCRTRKVTQKITRIPPLLAITLQRFITTNGADRAVNKLHKFLEITEKIDITDCIINHKKTTYTLESICCHTGDTPNNGHYYCYNKLLAENHWMKSDDDSVTDHYIDFDNYFNSPINITSREENNTNNNESNNNIYMLFYKQDGNYF